LIEGAYRTAEAMGLPVWCTDQAGPYQTIPYYSTPAVASPQVLIGS
jgi:hypothetical protein